MSSRPTLRLLACSLPLLLAACGGGGDDDSPAPTPTPTPTPNPLQSYLDQTLTWAACDPTILGRHSKDLDTLGSRATCATLRAPIDYANPSHGDIHMALLRVSAEQPSQRRGVIAFNPGGPGGDGLGLPVSVGALWTMGNPASDAGHQLKQLSNEFDLIGFSPRGVGASTQLTCGTNELERPTDHTTHGRTPANIDNMLYNARKTAEACLRNPLTPFINTDATVQDMDLMRAVLGEDKLHYIGYSYGTWLGAWYGSRYPERTGRFVLDSSMALAGSFQDNFTLQVGAFQRVLDEVLAPYAARHADVFQLGNTVEAVRAVHPALSPPVQNVVSQTLSDELYRRATADDALDLLAASRGLDEVLTHTTTSSPGALITAINHHTFDATDPERDERLRDKADDLFRKEILREPESFKLSASAATFAAVQCNDTPFTGDAAEWTRLGDELSQRYPLMGGSVTQTPCLYWGGTNVTRPALSHLAGHDILMVQSQYDGATATEGALAAFAALPQARLVYVNGEHQHGLFPYGTACVDGTVASYLLGTTPAARETQCDTLPLPLDASTQPQARSAQPPLYTDPARAAEILERIQRDLGRTPS